MRKLLPEVQLRVVLLAPLTGVPFALQHGEATHVGTNVSSGADLAFTFDVGFLLAEDSLDFRGPFVHGPRGGRFVYICSGELVDPRYTTWRRRAKVPLGGISSALLSDCIARTSGMLRVCISGKAKDGGPPAATVPLIDAWTVVAE
jgi:hypothetical protein